MTRDHLRGEVGGSVRPELECRLAIGSLRAASAKSAAPRAGPSMILWCRFAAVPCEQLANASIHRATRRPPKKAYIHSVR